jgi:CRISPR/Cas system-associated protein Csx1
MSRITSNTYGITIIYFVSVKRDSIIDQCVLLSKTAQKNTVNFDSHLLFTHMQIQYTLYYKVEKK